VLLLSSSIDQQIAIMQTIMLLLLFLFLLLPSFGAAAAVQKTPKKTLLFLAKKGFCLQCWHVFSFFIKTKKEIPIVKYLHTEVFHVTSLTMVMQN